MLFSRNSYLEVWDGALEGGFGSVPVGSHHPSCPLLVIVDAQVV